MTRVRIGASLLGALLLTATSASAQVLGTFSWQMQPYCNVVTLTLTAVPGTFTLDGTDDQCGAATKGTASGVAAINPNGNVSVNFTIVTSPGGKGVQVSAQVSPADGQGTWTDSVGSSGTFALGVSTGGPLRPLPASGLGPSVITTTEIAPGAVGASDINTAEVQARVTGTCPSGQAVTGVNANGTVVCAATGVANVQFNTTGQFGQSVPNNVATPVTNWFAVQYNDGGGIYIPTSGTYIVPVTGLYSVSISVFYVGGFAASQAGFEVVRNGARIGATTTSANVGDSFVAPTVTIVKKFSAGDAVQVRAFQNSGATRTLFSSVTEAFFSVTLIR